MKTSRNLRVALAVIAFAQLMVVLDTTIVNVALPSIGRALGFHAADLEWVINGYAIAFGGLLLLGGRLGDLFGRRRVFVAGILLFAAASLAGGLAPTAGWLVAARAVQGAGGAIIAPTALSLITDTFAEGDLRNRALGVYAGAAGGGGVAGLVLGGLIVNYVSWRWVLFVNVPVAVVLAVVAPGVLPASRRRRGRLDIVGAATITAAVAAVVYGLSRAATSGWSEPATVAWLAAGVGLMAAFALVERTSAEPLLRLGMLADGNRAGAYLMRMVAGATTLSVLYFLTQVFQLELGYSPLRAGLAFLPLGAGVVLTAQAASRLVARAGARLLVTAGAFFVAVGTFWLSRMPAHPGYAGDVLPGLILVAVGLGLVFLPTTVVAVAGASRQESGLAAAVLNVAQQLGGSLGLAVLATVTVDQGLDSALAAWSVGVLAAAALAALMIGAPARAKAAEPLGEAA